MHFHPIPLLTTPPTPNQVLAAPACCPAKEVERRTRQGKGVGVESVNQKP